MTPWLDFTEKGLDIHDPLFQKLWRVASIQGHFDPWHPRLLNKTEAQLDAILEAYAEDFPKRLKFERRGARKDRDTVETLSLLWADKLTGKGRDTLRSKVAFKIPDNFRQSPNATSARPVPRRK